MCDSNCERELGSPREVFVPGAPLTDSSFVDNSDFCIVLRLGRVYWCGCNFRALCVYVSGSHIVSNTVMYTL